MGAEVNDTGRATLEGVQSLRAIAALAVVVYHAASRAGGGFPIGAAGVDVFFVVSGFIMWTVRARGAGPGTFLRDRFLRIAPLYWLATAGMLAGGLLGLFPNLKLESGHVLASFLFWPHASPDGEVWPLLVQGWTLNYEMAFYALFAMALMLPRGWQLAALVSALTGLTLAGFAFPEGPNALTFYTDPIILEFAAGVLIGALWTRGIAPGVFLGWTLTALGAGLFIAQGFTPDLGERAVFWGGPAALLVAGVVSLERRGVVLSNPGLLFLGNASYSIYLFHTFAISFVLRYFGIIADVWAETLIGAIAGTAGGALVYVLVEKRLIAAFKAKRRSGSMAPDPARSLNS